MNSYFRNIFIASNTDNDRLDFLDDVSPIINEQQNILLTEDFNMEEFTLAIKQMHGVKAPGRMGSIQLFTTNVGTLLERNYFIPVFSGCVKAHSQKD